MSASEQSPTVETGHFPATALDKKKEKLSRKSQVLWQANQNDPATLMKLLEEDPSLATSRDYDNRTSLHVAALHGWTDVAKRLLEYGADVNAQDRWKNTPLADAERAKQYSIIELLKSYGGSSYVNNNKVFKYSKHCRVCDKCVDQFNQRCGWLNNCVGKMNYHKFSILIVSSLLLLILQWSTGIIVLVLCFKSEIISKLGSSYSLLPFGAVVAICTILAMIATLPLAQLLFFHILLRKKGISRYDYIISLREQDQQSPQMSPASSSITGLSRFDVVSADTISGNSPEKNKNKMKKSNKINASSVKISPCALTHLNEEEEEEVIKAAAEKIKKFMIWSPSWSRPTSDDGYEASDEISSCIAHRTRNWNRPPMFDPDERRVVSLKDLASRVVRLKDLASRVVRLKDLASRLVSLKDSSHGDDD